MSTLESFPHDPDITHQEDLETALPNSYAEATVKTKPENYGQATRRYTVADVSQATAECLREEPRNANGEYINEHLAFLQGKNSLPGEYSLI
jgi:hypothetical protein